MDVKDWLNTQLGQDIWEKKYRHNNESFEDWLNRVTNGSPDLKDCIKKHKFLFGGRTLTNRLTGKGSLSNCYCSGRVEDSLPEIMDTCKKIALTFKAQGGQGLSLSNIRPKGALVNDSFESDGIIPFLEIFNTVTASVSQGGSRRGALMVSLDVNHPEIEDFIKIKLDENKINNANLSVEIDDKFMHAVDEYYKTGKVVTYTVPNKYKGGNSDGYEITPINIYKYIMKCAWKSAEPGVMFMNRFSNYNLMELVDDYIIHTSNPCGEQPLPSSGACNLSSVNLSEYVLNPFTDLAQFDTVQFVKDIALYVKEMDMIIDENAKLHALPEQQEFAKNYRNIGIGIMGLADCLLKLGFRYGSKPAVEFIDEIGSIMFRSAVVASAFLAQELGSFPKYSEKVWDSKIMKKHFDSHEIEVLKQKGLRNASLLSVAPTGSIATMLNVSTGVEPFFALKYKRRTVSLNGDKDVVYDVELPIVEEFKRHTQFAEKHKDALVTAEDIPWNDRIHMQAALQTHIDTAISATINLPEKITVEEIEQLYLYAWKKGLKGVTIFRSGSRKPILSTKDTTIETLTKRPESLNAKVIRFKNKSEDWIAVIGVMNDKPYEIFTGKVNLDDFPLPKYIEDGQIIKVRSENEKRYDFQYTDKYSYVNRLGGLSRIFNQEYWNYAKLISALLRGGTSVDKVIKIVDGLDLDSDTLNTWKNGVIRALKKFVEDGTTTGSKCPECGDNLIYTAGCISCASCGYSKCG